MYRFMSKQFIALFAGLLVLYFSPKNAWSDFEKKNWYRFCRSFTFHVHLAFERHTGTEGREPLLSCSVYFVRIPLPLELISFFCTNL